MIVEKHDIKGLLTITIDSHPDNRGVFYEGFNEKEFRIKTGLNKRFVQDNFSFSVKNVLRGMHYQVHKPQAKLVMVTRGEIFDVAVDLRRKSQTFGRWFGIYLSNKNFKQLYIPEGFAHGFAVISNEAHVVYKTSEFYYPEFERSIIWNDSDLNIDWPISNPTLSKKDQHAENFKLSECFQ